MKRPIAACWRPLLFGLLGLGLAALLPTCAGPNARAGAQHLVADAESIGSAAMAAAGASWAQLKIGADGVARLVGDTPSPEAAAAALAAAQQALANQTGFPGVIARFSTDSAGATLPPDPPATAPAVAAVKTLEQKPETTANAAPAPPAQPATVAAATAPAKAATPTAAAPTTSARADLETAGPLDCQRSLNAAMRANPIRFASGSATVAGVGRENFAQLAAVVAACDRHRLRVDGHTDRRGGTAFNQRLSEDRARAVVALLTAAGADARTLSAWGYGETRPLDRRATPAAHSLNRRIEITVLAP
jgi:outer membrane protein OmpA-like peptidoglycan-associated protein